MIAVIDYGAGNLASVRKGLEVAAGNVCRPSGAAPPSVRITSDPEEIARAAAVVLPGVGHFGDAADNLRRRGLEGVVREAFQSYRPFLGICVGLQLLFEGSEESPGVSGLALIAGSVRRFAGNLKVPHMGWNQLALRKEHRVLDGLQDGTHAYFVHSFYPRPDDDQVTATVTDYGGEFCSSVAFGSVFACQFHPEKSQRVGMRILESFVRYTLDARDPSH